MFPQKSALLAQALLTASCLLAPLLPAAETAVSPAPVASTQTMTETERAELVAGNNQVALDLLVRIGTKEKNNFFFSPFSIRTALAMAYAGAKGATAAEMKQALHLSLADDRLHNVLGESIATLNAGVKGGPEVAVANSLWGERSNPFLQPFIDLNRTAYRAGLELVDFKGAPDEQRKRINHWVAEQTKQKILDLIPPNGVASDTRLALVNAVYFKGMWSQPFDKAETTDEAWGNGKVRVPLMQRTAEYRYTQKRMVDNSKFATGVENGIVQILELPYVGGTISMLVLLPSENTILQEVERELTTAKLTTAIQALKLQRVHVSLPRFRMTWGTADLGPNQLGVLPELGMKTPFAYPQADFSGIDGTRELVINSVYHKAFVDVDEQGTEAAAATAVVEKIGGLSQQIPIFRADRPFLFLIRDQTSGMILFVGRVMKP